MTVEYVHVAEIASIVARDSLFFVLGVAAAKFMPSIRHHLRGRTHDHR